MRILSSKINQMCSYICLFLLKPIEPKYVELKEFFYVVNDG